MCQAAASCSCQVGYPTSEVVPPCTSTQECSCCLCSPHGHPVDSLVLSSRVSDSQQTVFQHQVFTERNTCACSGPCSSAVSQPSASSTLVLAPHLCAIHARKLKIVQQQRSEAQNKHGCFFQVKLMLKDGLMTVANIAAMAISGCVQAADELKVSDCFLFGSYL